MLEVCFHCFRDKSFLWRRRDFFHFPEFELNPLILFIRKIQKGTAWMLVCRRMLNFLIWVKVSMDLFTTGFPDNRRDKGV